MKRLLLAFEFAERAHRGQHRKYTGEPYIVHPIEVAQIMSMVTGDEEVLIAALFHDLVEDTAVTLEQIRKVFGERVAVLVHEVTDVSRKEHGNRALRKALDREHLARASFEGKSIKLADLISNTQSITHHDPDFARVYMKEKAALLPLLSDGSPALLMRASALVRAWEESLLQKALEK